MPRREDDTLLRGAGTTVADLRLPDTVELTSVRSAVPHGDLDGVDMIPALDGDGVLPAVLNAVADALRVARSDRVQLPAMPERVSRLARQPG